VRLGRTPGRAYQAMTSTASAHSRCARHVVGEVHPIRRCVSSDVERDAEGCMVAKQAAAALTRRQSGSGGATLLERAMQQSFTNAYFLHRLVLETSYPTFPV
jgi:hypothetical protein